MAPLIKSELSILTGDAGCTPEEWTCIKSSASDQLSTCESPEVIVTDISPNNGTSQEIITITGVGFSSQDCNNVILFGGRY